MKSAARKIAFAGLCAFILATPATSQSSINGWPVASDSLPGEATFAYKRLIIEGGTLIDGTGAPPVGPVTVIVESGKISEIYGLSGMYTAQLGKTGRPEIRPGDRHIDARGQYILPGLIDTHVRVLDLAIGQDAGNTSRTDNAPPDYALKLLVANGVTTISTQQSLAVMDWALNLRDRAAANRITAPNIEVWVDFPARTAEEARVKVREAAKRGAKGLGEGDIEGPLAAMLAGLDEAKKFGLRTYWCLHDDKIQQMNALDWARAGLSGLPHMKGLPNALRTGESLASYPAGFNYSSEADAMSYERWRGVEPGNARWNAVIDELVKLDFTLTPTFAVYEAFRDYESVRHAPWFDSYAHPAVLRSFGESDPESVFNRRGLTEEIHWRRDFQTWMRFVNDFKNRGGRVTAGSDSGYYWTLPGFGLIRNMELLQEAGFHPLEVIRSATLESAQWLGISEITGSIEVGKRADIIVSPLNPLENLRVLYATGVPGKTADGTKTRIGGVSHTIRGGVIYDAKAVAANVRSMVNSASAPR